MYIQNKSFKTTNCLGVYVVEPLIDPYAKPLIDNNTS